MGCDLQMGGISCSRPIFDERLLVSLGFETINQLHLDVLSETWPYIKRLHSFDTVMQKQ